MNRKFGFLFTLLLILTLLAAAWPQPAGASQSRQNVPASELDALTIALDTVKSSQVSLGLTDADLGDLVVTDQYFSESTGLTHIYLRQRHKGIEVFNANVGVNIYPDGQVLNWWSQLVPDAAGQIKTTQPQLSAQQAVEKAASALKLTLTEPLVVLAIQDSPDQKTMFNTGGISLEPIPARLVYQPLENSGLQLAWDLAIYELSAQHYWNLRIDAITGNVLEQDDWVDYDSYTVYPIPVETPNHTTPVPPADGRVVVTNPANATASPFGWHDTNGVAGAEFTITQGNNAHAYTDTDANNLPDVGSEPSGGVSLNFNPAIDLTQQPSVYRPAAVTNLFYWNNIVHDVFYQYGFNEAAGNFQVNNYGLGGTGSDSVNAEAQDGSGTNNANFATPPDGSPPRMQMFVGTNPNPDVDGDLDNMVIAHEYGHGISNRLTGGPSNVSCLNNQEQMGEGWSDFIGLVLTARATDTSTTARGVGTYLFGQPANGIGIRPAPYTTDMGVSSYTYGNIPSLAVPHGVGFVWASMVWEMYWNLVSKYGYNPNIYGAWNTGGNNLAVQLVVDGMKLQPCSPGFVDGRNAILAADQALTGGVNQCTIWSAFAKRGLGFSALQGLSSSISDGTQAFDIPAACSTIAVTPVEQSVCVNTNALYTAGIGSAFTAPVTLSGSGNPAPTTLSFNPNPVNSLPTTSQMTVGNTGTAPAGSYTLTVTATDSTVTHSTQVNLIIVATPPSASTLAAPADGATDVSLKPTFQWSAAAGASSYLLQVATDVGFTNVVYTATVPGLSHTAATNLLDNQEYFWRVSTSNVCGNGASSSVFHFTTQLAFCSTPNLTIPDNLGGGISNTLTVPLSGLIKDLNVSINADHTWVGDLKFRLQAPNGTQVTLIDRPGVPTTTFGCSNNNINALLDDEGIDGPVENQCWSTPPALFGNPTPNNLLSGFDGAQLAGSWVLNISDNAGGDTGKVNEWCLLPTLPSADVSAQKSVLPAYVAANGWVTYTISYANAGPDIASSVTITDIVPITLTQVTYTSSGAAIVNTGVTPGYVWTVASLPVGTGGTITITGKVTNTVTGLSSLINQVTIASLTRDSNLNNNTSSASNQIDAQPPTTSLLQTPPANDSTPTFTFEGDDGAGSGVAGFECQMDSGPWAACSSPYTSSALADGEHTFHVRAYDALGNVDASPATFTWTIDTVAPETSLLQTPPANDSTPTFTFAGDDGAGSGVAGFECQMDSGAWAACSSPYTSSALADGGHTFHVRAYDALGNVDASPATFTWTITTTRYIYLPIILRAP